MHCNFCFLVLFQPLACPHLGSQSELLFRLFQIISMIFPQTDNLTLVLTSHCNWPGVCRWEATEIELNLLAAHFRWLFLQHFRWTQCNIFLTACLTGVTVGIELTLADRNTGADSHPHTHITREPSMHVTGLLQVAGESSHEQRETVKTLWLKPRTQQLLRQATHLLHTFTKLQYELFAP